MSSRHRNIKEVSYSLDIATFKDYIGIGIVPIRYKSLRLHYNIQTESDVEDICNLEDSSRWIHSLKCYRRRNGIRQNIKEWWCFL